MRNFFLQTLQKSFRELVLPFWENACFVLSVKPSVRLHDLQIEDGGGRVVYTACVKEEDFSTACKHTVNISKY